MSEWLRLPLAHARGCLRSGVVPLLVVIGVGFVSCSPKPKERVTLTYMAGDLPKDQQAVVREILVAFEKEFPYIHVEPKFEKFNKLQAPQPIGPDVFFTTADDLPVLMDREWIVDITPQVTIEKTLLDPYYAEVVAACKLDSRQVMMPVCYGTDLLFYNQDLLIQTMRDHKIAVNLQDLDWESIPKFAQPFVKREGDRITRYALACPRPLLLIQAWGANLFAWNDVTIRNDLTRSALQYYVSLVKEKLVPPPDSPEAGLPDIDLFKQQKIVFFVGPGELLAEADKIKDFKWDIAPAPKGPKRMQPGMPAPGSMEPPQPVEVWPRYGRLSVNGNCIWINSAHFAEAWEFVRFFSSEPAQRIWARVRAGVPAMKVVAEGTEFLHQPPGHVDVLLISRQHSRLDNTHSLVFFDEFILQSLRDTSFRLLRGILTVDQAIDELEGLAKDTMEQAKAKKR